MTTLLPELQIQIARAIEAILIAHREQPILGAIVADLPSHLFTFKIGRFARAYALENAIAESSPSLSLSVGNRPTQIDRRSVGLSLGRPTNEI
jgi:hypothetical protein